MNCYFMSKNKIFVITLSITRTKGQTRIYKTYTTRNVCITKYACLYKLSNGIMVMTPN